MIFFPLNERKSETMTWKFNRYIYNNSDCFPTPKPFSTLNSPVQGIFYKLQSAYVIESVTNQTRTIDKLMVINQLFAVASFSYGK